VRIDPVWAQIISELCVNLSAGWIGAAVVIPVTSKLDKKINLGLLTMNLAAGIVFLTVAFELRRRL
jgi:hypothetical protein